MLSLCNLKRSVFPSTVYILENEANSIEGKKFRLCDVFCSSTGEMAVYFWLFVHCTGVGIKVVLGKRLVCVQCIRNQIREKRDNVGPSHNHIELILASHFPDTSHIKRSQNIFLLPFTYVYGKAYSMKFET